MLTSHPNSAPSQTVLEIRVRGDGLSVYSPPVWTPHFYEVHRCGSFPSEADGIRILNYLDDRLVLADSEQQLITHRSLLPNHLERLGLKINPSKSFFVSQTTSILSGNNQMGLCANACLDYAGTFPDYPVSGGIFQTGDFASPQGLSEDARPHGRYLLSHSSGPSAYEAPPILAKILRSVPCVRRSIDSQREPPISF